MIISQKHKFLYCSIPKVASTTLHTYFEKNFDCKKTFSLLDLKNIDFADYTIFTLTRNPWERLVSCWTQKCFIDDQYLQNAKFFIKYKNIEFKDFVKVIEKEITDDGKSPDAHITPQSTLLDGYKEEIGDVEILMCKLENITEDLNIILEKLGAKSYWLPHKNRSKHTYYTEHYDEETRQIVAKKYARDIEQFGYKFGE